jgi:(1->4)-alpha-D-glucan 1-alpha-D-glucosylmutase
MEKAMREAKLRTSWTAPDEAYEGAVKAFVERIADADKSGAFLDDFRPFQRRVSEYGLVNSLAQTVLRLTAPGVPDTYQGTELWDFSLVDPDNRRPVDYDLRRRLLEDVEAATASALDLSGTARRLWQSRADGKVKLLVTSRALKVRAEHPGLFTLGEYLPARADGRAADHVFAFARRHEGRHAVVIVPRRVASLGIDPADPEAFRGAFGATRVLLTGIPNGIRLRDVFSGRTLAAEAGAVDVASALADLPVALLVQE